MKFEITGAETADQLIKQLVFLRQCARRLIITMKEADDTRDTMKRKLAQGLKPGGKEAGAELLARIEETRVDIRFAQIEIGNYMIHLCPALDKKVSREGLFEAINTNRADRDTDEVRKYGDKASHILFVLDLENSATQDEGCVTRPLKWCHTMAFMNAMQTNSKLDRVIHDGANEFFNGAFGEYRERPLMERLVGRTV